MARRKNGFLSGLKPIRELQAERVARAKRRQARVQVGPRGLGGAARLLAREVGLRAEVLDLLGGHELRTRTRAGGRRRASSGSR